MLTTGDHLIVVNCPDCNAPVIVGLTLTGVLQVDDDGGVIKLRARSKPVFHTCNDNEPTLLDEDDDG